MHAELYLVAFFQKYLIVLAERDAEDDGRYVFEAVDPFFPFTSLTADVKHTAACQWTALTSRGANGVTYCMLNWPIVNRVS